MALLLCGLMEPMALLDMVLVAYVVPLLGPETPLAILWHSGEGSLALKTCFSCVPAEMPLKLTT